MARSPDGPFTARDLRTIATLLTILRIFLAIYLIGLCFLFLDFAGLKFLAPFALLATICIMAAPLINAPLIFKLNPPFPALVLFLLSLGPFVSFILTIFLHWQAIEALRHPPVSNSQL